MDQRATAGVELGRLGEDAALQRYRRAGYRAVARNWRCRIGEIDLILARGRTLVVCEVKARRGSGHGAPFEAVHRRKQEKLRLLAEAFLATEARTVAVLETVQVRFDVASITVTPGGVVSVHVFEDAF